MPNADELLDETLDLFERDIKKADIKVAVTNVRNWIEFLTHEEHPAAGPIAFLLREQLLPALELKVIENACKELQEPTAEQGDPTAPPASRPRKISRLGQLVGAWM